MFYYSLPSILQVAVRCWEDGRVLVRVDSVRVAVGAALYDEIMYLPRPINAASARALFTPAGQLYIRVNMLE